MIWVLPFWLKCIPIRLDVRYLQATGAGHVAGKLAVGLGCFVPTSWVAAEPFCLLQSCYLQESTCLDAPNRASVEQHRVAVTASDIVPLRRGHTVAVFVAHERSSEVCVPGNITFSACMFSGGLASVYQECEPDSTVFHLETWRLRAFSCRDVVFSQDIHEFQRTLDTDQCRFGRSLVKSMCRKP